jgi:Outer membrane protein beta-barrel family/Carboxypeptidase regulatory-like domain
MLCVAMNASGQSHALKGLVQDEHGHAIRDAVVAARRQGDTARYATTDKDGRYLIPGLRQGLYRIAVSAMGYEPGEDSTRIDQQGTDAGIVYLRARAHELDEVKIAAKVLAMVQKDDTTEYNAAAYKVNPDADAADLVRKMPALEIDNKEVKAQGETVTKIVVDGKPFFGSDPYAALKNLPAEVVERVQVYNERSDQEQFTGFHEGPTTKTINIITKADKRNCTMGKVYAGGGGDNSDNGKYGTGGTLNDMAGDRRVTVTAQANNISEQNFTDNAAGGGGAGLQTTGAAGINYSDKAGKNTDYTVSYLYNNTATTGWQQLAKTYTLPSDSGEVNRSQSASNSHNTSHRASLRVNEAIDSMNSLLLQGGLSVNGSNNDMNMAGSTDENSALLNQTTNSTNTHNTTTGLNGSLLYRHKTHKKGRTLSMTTAVADNNGSNDMLHGASELFYNNSTPDDTLNQQSKQHSTGLNVNANVTYTEPTGRHGLLKVAYIFSGQYATSDKSSMDYSPVTRTYSVPDTLYSNIFSNHDIAHRAGASYQYSTERYDVSAGVDGQVSLQHDRQTMPETAPVNEQFNSVLPMASFRYKLSKTRNLQCNYATSTQAPSANQLQPVTNNADPLHLYTGNPDLKQPYQHNVTCRYSSSDNEGKHNFSLSLNGSYVLHSIVTNSIIARSDTMVNKILLPASGQLSIPVNRDGRANAGVNASYSMPLTAIKCRMNLSVNGSISHTPSVINSIANTQDSRSASINAAVSSNISEQVDFLVSNNIGYNVTSNTVNIDKAEYMNGASSITLNILLKCGLVLKTAFSYQYNSGSQAGFNQDYALWNVSIGEKIFKHRQGEIRLSVYDLLNNNADVQRTVTDIYIQDSRSNVVQRYALMVFTYQIKNFRKGVAP